MEAGVLPIKTGDKKASVLRSPTGPCSASPLSPISPSTQSGGEMRSLPGLPWPRGPVGPGLRRQPRSASRPPLALFAGVSWKH